MKGIKFMLFKRKLRMPYMIMKTKNGYGVKNILNNHWFSYDIPYIRALKQLRLLKMKEKI